jgi:aryl-alcohol dehydrogenase-like predicted oxidoreductase
MPVGGVVGKRQLFRPDGPLVSEIGFGAWYGRIARAQRRELRAAALSCRYLQVCITWCLRSDWNCNLPRRPIGGAFGEVERRTGIETVQAAVRLGASFIDTADCA